MIVWPWALGDRATAIAEMALALVERDIPARSDRSADAAAGPPGRACSRAGRRGNRARPGLDPRRGPAAADRLDQRHERQDHDDAPHRPHAPRGGQTGRRDDVRRDRGRRARSSSLATGPGPAARRRSSQRDDLDVAVLETARGGILLRGVGYESNEASVITNVSSDHMDLQGIHTLPELVEVKSVIARITKPSGWVVLNADDRWVAGIARTVQGKVAFFSVAGDRSPARATAPRGPAAGRTSSGTAGSGEAEGERWRPIAALADIPVALGGVARHNVANALAAVGAARALGVSLAVARRALQSFVPSTLDSRGRLNVFRDDRRVVVVDFAHNEAGVAVLLDVVEAIARSTGDSRRAPISAIVGLAGDRPDDTLRGVGREVARRVDRFVQKEMLHYLRGRTRESVLGEIRAGALEGGWTGEIPVYGSEPEALGAELDRTEDALRPEVIVLLCHEDREGVYDLISKRGLRPIDDPAELARLVSSP